jgi:hypothetical protein
MASPVQFGDVEKFTKALVSGNKLASELLRKATALQSKLAMIEQEESNSKELTGFASQSQVFQHLCFLLTISRTCTMSQLDKLDG